MEKRAMERKEHRRSRKVKQPNQKHKEPKEKPHKHRHRKSAHHHKKQQSPRVRNVTFRGRFDHHGDRVQTGKDQVNGDRITEGNLLVTGETYLYSKIFMGGLPNFSSHEEAAEQLLPYCAYIIKDQRPLIIYLVPPPQ
jgi:hypothetical protein